MANGVIIPNMVMESGTDSTSYGSIKWKKTDNLVYIEFHPSSVSSTEWRTLGILPTQCRPTISMYYCSWADGATANVRYLVNSSGEVRVIGTAQTDSSATFMV